MNEIEHTQGELARLPQISKKFDVAGAFLAESEVGTNHEVSNAQSPDKHLIYEFLWSEVLDLAQVQYPQLVDTPGFQ